MLPALATVSLGEKQILFQNTFDSWGWVLKHLDKDRYGTVLDAQQKVQITNEDRAFSRHFTHVSALRWNQTQIQALDKTVWYHF